MLYWLIRLFDLIFFNLNGVTLLRRLFSRILFCEESRFESHSAATPCYKFHMQEHLESSCFFRTRTSHRLAPVSDTKTNLENKSFFNLLEHTYMHLIYQLFCPRYVIKLTTCNIS